MDPENLLAGTRLDRGRMVGHWETCLALDPEIALRRLTATLAPTPGVAFVLDGSTIRAQGSAPEQWVAQARGLIGGRAPH